MCLTVAEPPEAAEAAGIAKTQLGFARELGDEVGVGFNGCCRGFYCKAAGHSQVNAEGGIGVQANEDFLAAAVDRGDSAVVQQTDKISIARLDNVGPEVADGGEA